MRVPRGKCRNGGRPFQDIDTKPLAWANMKCNVEMEVAPIQGIDTKKRNYISVLFVIVEMEVAPFRPLTQCYNCNNQRDVDSGRNEARPTQGIVTEVEQTRELSF